MANAQKPTPRTRHMDIKYFALSKWVERNLMFLERIDTFINLSDHFTKSLQTTLFHPHMDFLLGHIPPAYLPVYRSIIGTYTANDEYVNLLFLIHSLPPFPQQRLRYMHRFQPIMLNTHGFPFLSMGFTIHLIPCLVVLFAVDCGGGDIVVT